MKSKIESSIKIFDIPQDLESEYELTESSCDWVKELLNELNSDDNSDIDLSRNTDLTVNLAIYRKFNDSYKDHIAITASILGNYQTTCIRCLEQTVIPLKVETSSCFLPDSLEEKDDFFEVEDLYIFNKQMDLNFYKKRKIELKELIHENIYLYKTHFPLHSTDCKGLCGQCGVNLNIEKCKHQLSASQ